MTHNVIDVHIGTRLVARRQELGASAEGLAQILGIPADKLRQIELGMARMGAEDLFRAASVLKVPISFFYEGLE